MIDVPMLLQEALPSLRRYANKIARADAEDLLQDTCVRILMKGHLFREGNFLGWALNIMHNTHVDHVRSAIRTPAMATDPSVFAELETAPDNPLINVELKEVLVELERLPRDKQRLILRAALTGDDHESMAAHEQLPLGTIRSRLSRAREEIRTRDRGATLSAEELSWL